MPQFACSSRWGFSEVRAISAAKTDVVADADADAAADLSNWAIRFGLGDGHTCQ